MKKVNLLIFVDYFTPGYKAGGPIQSVTNLISSICDDINVYVITRNHDWGSTEAYEKVEVNKWISEKNYHIKYLKNEDLSCKNLSFEIDHIKPDVLFLNSFFSKFTRKIIQLYWTKEYNISIVIAPRGELMDSAFAMHTIKKVVYLNILKLARLFKDVHWLSTSTEETNSIKKRVGSDLKITVINNTPNISEPIKKTLYKKRGELSLVFLSRIDPIKNLDFLLTVLMKCESIGNIKLDIFGSAENKKYLNLCKRMISSLPKNVSVNLREPIPNIEVLQTIAKYHFFILPTKGENFGHAIFESFIAGTPVIVSDRTPWINLRKSQVGVDLPLETEKWVSALRFFIDMENKCYLKFHGFCMNFIKKHRNIQKTKEEYINFFTNKVVD